jgi:hypothetical protein
LFAESRSHGTLKRSLRRKPHVRRQHSRALSHSDYPVKFEAVLEVPVSPNGDRSGSGSGSGNHDDLDGREQLTPLIESLTNMYAVPQRRHSSYTISSPLSEKSLDSPSEYSDDDEDLFLDDDDDDDDGDGDDAPLSLDLDDDELLFHTLPDSGVTTLHDWDNGIHYRDARLYGVPEGRLLPKRAPTRVLADLLRARRQRAGLSVDFGNPDPVDDR